ncbi:MAG: efflux RND transporter periplasmic adaptor subunit [Candidatus Binatia bacterium]
MKKIVITVIVFLALGTLFYSLGVGPFKEELAKGQQRGGRRRGKTVSVKVAKVRIGDVEEKLSYVGSLMPNASVMVAPKIAGRVEKLFVRVGDLVKEGQIVARLEKDELAEDLKEAEASLNVYKATLKGKEAELSNLERKLERSKILFEKDLIAREAVDTLETQVLSGGAQVELTKAQMAQMRSRLDNARIRLNYTEVISPFAGYVGKRFVDRGALVNPNTPLVSIVDISSVRVDISVVEKDYRKISSGQLADVTADAYPGRRFQGKVARVAPVLNQETRTGGVEIELPNPAGNLKPGMFARAEIVVQRRSGVLLIPEGAQVRTPKGYGVFKVLNKGSKVRLVSVKTGISHKGWVEIKGSLQPGDRVVTLGSNLLRDGQKVTVIEERPAGRAGNARRKRRRKQR